LFTLRNVNKFIKITFALKIRSYLCR